MTVLERERPKANPQAAAAFKRRLAQLVAEGRADGVPSHELAVELRQLAAGLSKEKKQ